MAKGQPEAANRLLPVVYDELRRLAALRLAQEQPGMTLQATALVHEAYLRLIGPNGERNGLRWDSRGHFFAAAAEAMRRILIENARRRKSLKRGQGCQKLDVDRINLAVDGPSDELLDLDEAIQLFAEEDPVKTELVKLRFYGGLSVEEAAACLGISRATADRYWAYARAWLYDRLHSRP